MVQNESKAITEAEIEELMSNPTVRLKCGIPSIVDEAARNAFRAHEFVAKFDYWTDGLGYSGDLYVVVCSPECIISIVRDAQGELCEIESKAA